MAVYFSTFITGFQDAVNGLIKDMVKDTVILKLLDGLIMYETNINLDAIKAIKIFNNTFLTPQKNISVMIETVRKVNVDNSTTELNV